jgi:hypothetical protein
MCIDTASSRQITKLRGGGDEVLLLRLLAPVLDVEGSAEKPVCEVKGMECAVDREWMDRHGSKINCWTGQPNERWQAPRPVVAF